MEVLANLTCALARVQLAANAVLFASVNLSGVFVRILTERTQRKVFLQARSCIEERLRLEDENEKQVSCCSSSCSSSSSSLSFFSVSGASVFQPTCPRARGVTMTPAI